MKENKSLSRDPTMHLDVKAKKGRSGLGREVQNKIGQQLRAAYDDVVNQGVPERFADILRQMDAPNAGAQGGSSDPSQPGQAAEGDAKKESP